MANIVMKDLENYHTLDDTDMSLVYGGKGRLGKLASAFRFGWKIGKYLDKKYKLSDRIAGTGKYWR